MPRKKKNLPQEAHMDEQLPYKQQVADSSSALGTKCQKCGAEINLKSKFPHECNLYPPKWMQILHGDDWRDKFPNYDGSRRKRPPSS